MATDLQATLNRIASKSEVLLERYRALEADRDAALSEIETLRSRLAEAELQIQKLRMDYEYLQVARIVTPTREAAAKGQELLSAMVQDIDKCISQLMD